MRRSLAARGFTLVELVITVAIVALLASVALPVSELAVQRTKEQDLRRTLRQMREAIDAYKQASDEGRIKKSVGDSGYPKKLEELAEGVEDQKSPKKDKIYFLRRIPRDPFATDPLGRRDLGQAQLLEPARRPPRRRRRLRCVLSRSGQGDQRAAVPRMVSALQTRRAFTLIELLVVMAIIAVLLTLAVPRYFGS